jgi:hypothetical protein
MILPRNRFPPLWAVGAWRSPAGREMAAARGMPQRSDTLLRLLSSIVAPFERGWIGFFFV